MTPKAGLAVVASAHVAETDPRQLIAQFLRHKVDIRGDSPRTAKNYRLDLMRLARFADAHCRHGWDWLDLEPSDVRLYARKQLMRGLKMRSLSRHISAIKNFYWFLYRHHNLDNPRIRNMPTPKFGRTLPHWLTLAQMDRLFSYLHARAANDGPRAVRNLAIVETFLLYGNATRGARWLGSDGP